MEKINNIFGTDVRHSDGDFKGVKADYRNVLENAEYNASYIKPFLYEGLITYIKDKKFHASLSSTGGVFVITKNDDNSFSYKGMDADTLDGHHFSTLINDSIGVSTSKSKYFRYNPDLNVGVPIGYEFSYIIGNSIKGGYHSYKKDQIMDNGGTFSSPTSVPDYLRNPGMLVGIPESYTLNIPITLSPSYVGEIKFSIYHNGYLYAFTSPDVAGSFTSGHGYIYKINTTDFTSTILDLGDGIGGGYIIGKVGNYIYFTRRNSTNAAKNHSICELDTTNFTITRSTSYLTDSTAGGTAFIAGNYIIHVYQSNLVVTINDFATHYLLNADGSPFSEVNYSPIAYNDINNSLYIGHTVYDRPIYIFSLTDYKLIANIPAATHGLNRLIARPYNNDNSDDTYIYAQSSYYGSLARLNKATNTYTDTIYLGDYTRMITKGSDNVHSYISIPTSAKVSKYNLKTGTFIKDITVPGGFGSVLMRIVKYRDNIISSTYSQVSGYYYTTIINTNTDLVSQDKSSSVAIRDIEIDPVNGNIYSNNLSTIYRNEYTPYKLFTLRDDANDVFLNWEEITWLKNTGDYATGIIQYTTDLSSKFTDYTLVNKKWVVDQITAAISTPYTFSNGLLNTSGSVTLGGTITSYTQKLSQTYNEIRYEGSATPANNKIVYEFGISQSNYLLKYVSSLEEYLSIINSGYTTSFTKNKLGLAISVNNGSSTKNYNFSDTFSAVIAGKTITFDGALKANTGYTAAITFADEHFTTVKYVQDYVKTTQGYLNNLLNITEASQITYNGNYASEDMSVGSMFIPPARVNILSSPMGLYILSCEQTINGNVEVYNLQGSLLQQWYTNYNLTGNNGLSASIHIDNTVRFTEYNISGEKFMYGLTYGTTKFQTFYLSAITTEQLVFSSSLPTNTVIISAKVKVIKVSGVNIMQTIYGVCPNTGSSATSSHTLYLSYNAIDNSVNSSSTYNLTALYFIRAVEFDNVKDKCYIIGSTTDNSATTQYNKLYSLDVISSFSNPTFLADININSDEVITDMFMAKNNCIWIAVTQIGNNNAKLMLFNLLTNTIVGTINPLVPARAYKSNSNLSQTKFHSITDIHYVQKYHHTDDLSNLSAVDRNNPIFDMINLSEENAIIIAGTYRSNSTAINAIFGIFY